MHMAAVWCLNESMAEPSEKHDAGMGWRRGMDGC